MKQLYKFSRLTFAILLASSSVSSLKAQDVSQIIKFGPTDATKLSQAYFSPAFKGFGFGMNSAWYSSAKAKNLGKFDLKIIATGALVPTKDQSFKLADLGLSQNIGYQAGATTPTLFGKDELGAEVKLYDNSNPRQEISKFNMPNGTGLNIVPSPQVELTVGLIKGTDVTVRYTPKIKGADFGSVQVLGLGVKHEITPYLFPGMVGKIIPFDLAVAFGYNQLTYKYDVPVAKQLNEDPSTAGQDLKQRIDVKLSGYTIDAIISKKLAIFTPFFSVGYNTAKSELGLLGKYTFKSGYNNLPLPAPANTPNLNSPKYDSITDPVKINQTDISGMRANVGFSLHLLVFRIYGAYSVGEYQAVTAGIGFGIGK